MPLIQDRRHFLTSFSLAGAASLFAHSKFASTPSWAASEPPPETTTVRIAAVPVACTAPLYLAEELLYEEGFDEVRYVPSTGMSMVSDGDVDFDTLAPVDYLPLADAGRPLTVLSGIHTGCLELRANDSIQTIADLRGKRVGVTTPLGMSVDYMLVSAMAAYVGIDPVSEINWVTDPDVSQVDLFRAGEVDAFVGFPPDPGQPCVRDVGHAVVNTAVDAPWSDYFCCMAIANPDFVRKNPVATKRVLRAILRATDLCAEQPERAVQRMVGAGFSAECARMILSDARYDVWREYDPEDSVRFYALQLHEAGMIKATPNEIIAGYTDWRFLDEVRSELKI